MPHYTGMPQAQADAYRAGAPDAYDTAPEIQTSDGSAPCRCCLNLIPERAEMLVLAYRPFEALHPYAETGPIFLCRQPCAPDLDTERPGILVSPDYLLKAYSSDERIIYGTGQITPLDDINAYADDLLARPDVAFVDLRSARNNCWQARLMRTAH